MGRTKKPVADHVKSGNYRPSRHGHKPTEEPAETFPDRPATMSGRLAEVWDRLARVLMGTVRPRDVATLEELCRWIERAERVEIELSKMTPTDSAFVKTLTGAAICTDKILKLSNCFGLSPSDRAKLRSEPSGSPAPKVKVRQQTKIDRGGKPKATAKKPVRTRTR